MPTKANSIINQEKTKQQPTQQHRQKTTGPTGTLDFTMRIINIRVSILCSLFILPDIAAAWQTSPSASSVVKPAQQALSRKSFLAFVGVAASTLELSQSSANAADLKFSQANSGIEWADAKVGSGDVKQMGEIAAIDYVMSTSGARYGSKIYATADKNAPYRWKLGDGTTIAGLEEAILGGPGMEAMKPGGIRRIIVPGPLAYATLAKPGNGDACQDGKGVGPIPPTFEESQRFKNIYCNPNLPYQPDLVMDIKLYGKRTNQ